MLSMHSCRMENCKIEFWSFSPKINHQTRANLSKQSRAKPKCSPGYTKWIKPKNLSSPQFSIWLLPQGPREPASLILRVDFWTSSIWCVRHQAALYCPFTSPRFIPLNQHYRRTRKEGLQGWATVLTIEVKKLFWDSVQYAIPTLAYMTTVYTVWQTRYAAWSIVLLGLGRMFVNRMDTPFLSQTLVTRKILKRMRLVIYKIHCTVTMFIVHLGSAECNLPIVV